MPMTLFQRSRSLLHLQALRAIHLSPRKSVAGTATNNVSHQWRLSSSSSAPTDTNRDRVRRRKRPNYGKIKVEGMGPPRMVPEQTGLTQPFSYGGADGESSEEYFKKTTLSPWVPIPDPIARKLFDMSAAGPEDIHVELGCGDGRVNFYAIDHGRVKKSTGIDVDDGILKQARERLGKRYPQPPLEFITADLLDYNNHEVWDKIQEATIITMYFVEDALLQIRPLLEEKLAGRQCKIITCAYEMKGWNPTIIETTLGTTVYLYNWGNMEDEDESFFVPDDNLLRDKPKELLEDPLEQMQKQGLDLDSIEQVRRTIIPDRHDPQDTWSDGEDESDEEDDESDAEEAKSPSKSPVDRLKKKRTPCSRT